MTDPAHRSRTAVPSGRTATPRALLSLVAVALLVAAGGSVLGALVPMLAGWESSVVGSGSMSPAVERGDVVVISPIPPERIAAGSVVRFDHPSRPGRAMLHRIARVTENGLLVTKGDANRATDATPVPASAITGLGRLRVRYAGLPVLWWLERDYPRLTVTSAVLLVLCLLVPMRKPAHEEGLP